VSVTLLANEPAQSERYAGVPPRASVRWRRAELLDRTLVLTTVVMSHGVALGTSRAHARARSFLVALALVAVGCGGSTVRARPASSPSFPGEVFGIRFGAIRTEARAACEHLGGEWSERHPTDEGPWCSRAPRDAPGALGVGLVDGRVCSISLDAAHGASRREQTRTADDLGALLAARHGAPTEECDATTPCADERTYRRLWWRLAGGEVELRHYWEHTGDIVAVRWQAHAPARCAR
jgi:hypothetical protein